MRIIGFTLTGTKPTWFRCVPAYMGESEFLWILPEHYILTFYQEVPEIWFPFFSRLFCQRCTIWRNSCWTATRYSRDVEKNRSLPVSIFSLSLPQVTKGYSKGSRERRRGRRAGLQDGFVLQELGVVQASKQQAAAPRPCLLLCQAVGAACWDPRPSLPATTSQTRPQEHWARIEPPPAPVECLSASTPRLWNHRNLATHLA